MEEEKKQEEIKKSRLEYYFDKKHITAKKIVKGTTLLFGLTLIIFMTLANVLLDPHNLDFFKWLTSSLLLVGIMIFGIFMGESIGQDKQKEDNKGLYQAKLKQYNTFREEIRPIDIYFSQFYIWFKEKELKRKKLNFLIDAGFDGQYAKLIIKHLTKNDLNNFYYRDGIDVEKIFVKGDIKIEKVYTEEEYETLKQMFELRIDGEPYSYYLTAFGSVGGKGQLEQGRFLSKKLRNDKRYSRALKIISSLVISLVLGMATVREFAEGEQLAAWVALITRLTAFFTSFVSGWSSSVISVKTEAEILNNKYNVLKTFQTCIDKQEFKPESYDERVSRLYQEQKEKEVIPEVIATPKVEEPLQLEEKPVVILPQKDVE